MAISSSSKASAAAQGGFTLVELVVVISVLGILAVGSVAFLRHSIDGYGLSEARADLAASSAVALARIAGELESALPNSVRTNGACLEFLLVRDITRYVDAPRVTAGTSVRLEAIAGRTAAPAAARLAINPDASQHVYDTSAGVLSPLASFSAPDGSGVVTASLASAYTFAEDSPQQRVHLVEGPVSYCVAADALYRYAGYAVTAAQPTPAALPTSSPARQLIAEGVDATATAFAAANASLERNATVSLRLALERGGDRLVAVRMAHVRAVP